MTDTDSEPESYTTFSGREEEYRINKQIIRQTHRRGEQGTGTWLCTGVGLGKSGSVDHRAGEGRVTESTVPKMWLAYSMSSLVFLFPDGGLLQVLGYGDVIVSRGKRLVFWMGA